jgi:hypothetical protein
VVCELPPLPYDYQALEPCIDEQIEISEQARCVRRSLVERGQLGGCGGPLGESAWISAARAAGQLTLKEANSYDPHYHQFVSA